MHSLLLPASIVHSEDMLSGSGGVGRASARCAVSILPLTCWRAVSTFCPSSLALLHTDSVAVAGSMSGSSCRALTSPWQAMDSTSDTFDHAIPHPHGSNSDIVMPWAEGHTWTCRVSVHRVCVKWSSVAVWGCTRTLVLATMSPTVTVHKGTLA